MANPAQTKAYLVGAGLSSLAAAAFLIKDGAIPGKNIFIFDEQQRPGGSLASSGDAAQGYYLGESRFLDTGFNSTWELLSFIPSLAESTRTVKQEIFAFHHKFAWADSQRLVAEGRKVEDPVLGFSTRDRLDLTELFAIPEDFLLSKRIDEWFHPGFFQTSFWALWAPSFGFLPWHSAVEFKRYLRRFVHLSGGTFSEGTEAFWPQYNLFDSVVRPLVRWLAERGVNFEMDVRVLDLDFKPSEKVKTVQRLRTSVSGRHDEINVNETDLVFVANGSPAANTSVGGMEEAPSPLTMTSGNMWRLWEGLATKFNDFGRPEAFAQHPSKTLWESFTVTATEESFFDLFGKFVGGEPHVGGFVTLRDSNWLLSVQVQRQPRFYEQPEDVGVWQGWALYPERRGNFVQKKMSECTGREILTEVLSHFHFMEELLPILNSSRCLPCLRPYGASALMPRERGTRPHVIPKGSTNFAFIGPFSEVPHEPAFTLEYSVRSAQMAVYQLLSLEKPVAALQRGTHEVGDLLKLYRGIKKGPPQGEPEHRL